MTSFFLVIFTIFPLAIVFWMALTYWRAPVEQLKDIYTYRPRGEKTHVLIRGQSFEQAVVREVGLGKSDNIEIENIPGYVLVALLFHEDDLFYCHHGFNWREVWQRIKAFATMKDRQLQGGSSIVQQLARTVFLPIRGSDQWLRKFVEAIYTIKIERTFTKNEILTLYLSVLRLGMCKAPAHSNGPGVISMYGFGSAAKEYFDKTASMLTLSECVFIFGLIPKPLWCDRNIRVLGNLEAYKYNNAFQKISDILRYFVNNWGWKILDEMPQISASQAIKAMNNFKSFAPTSFTPAFENVLRMRTLEIFNELRTLILQLAENSQYKDRPFLKESVLKQAVERHA